MSIGDNEPTHARAWHEEGDDLVTLIAFWPVEEEEQIKLDHKWVNRCRYRTACASAHWNLQLIETPDQAVIPEGIPVIALEEPYEVSQLDQLGHGYTSTKLPERPVNMLEGYVHPKDCTYIVGNTFYQRPSDHFECDELLGFNMDDVGIAAYSPLYGDQIAAILWWDRRMKNLQA